jgi:2-keto-4-pentenoate hydratase/2-oxohepta-3-ene-1,7-dioic acid hydratase in catechol pathway
MRWIRYSHAGRTAYGLLDGEAIAEVHGDPFAGYEPTGKTVAIDAVKIEIPVSPKTFYVAGRNYAVHAANYPGAASPTKAPPTRPEIGFRSTNSLIAHDEAVIIPHDASDAVHYEGELVVVIGKPGRRIAEADALSHVLGYTIGNDVSERTWQKSDSTAWRAKNTDTFHPIGPWIETAADLARMQTIVRLNGVETLRFSTDEMLFGIETYISAISQNCTLQAGDVIWMGTEGLSPDLKDGDVVEVEITGVGVLRNRFVREPAPAAG